MLKPTVIAVSTLTFDEPRTPATMFLIESGKSVSLKGLKFLKKFCKFFQLSLSLIILKFPLSSFISVLGTKEQPYSFSMASVTSTHNGRENTNKLLCTLLNPLPLVGLSLDLTLPVPCVSESFIKIKINLYCYFHTS